MAGRSQAFSWLLRRFPDKLRIFSIELREVLRFPNPGSTIENFVSVYGAAFERLNGRSVDLDDIVEAVVRANLATSSGYMGDEAVARSTRADRSRDPLYNQLKMYPVRQGGKHLQHGAEGVYPDLSKARLGRA